MGVKILKIINLMFSYFNHRDIVCFAGADWSTPLWTNRQHIMSRLSKNNRVLYIESVGFRTPNFASGSDWRKIISKIKRIFSPIRKISDNLYILSPLAVPYYNNGLVNFINKRLLFFQVNRAQKKLDFKHPILWSYLPHAIWLIGKIDFNCVVYHCVDQHAEIPGVASAWLSGIEKSFLKKCDVVFVTSLKLYESKKKYNKNTYYLPNVSDFSHFSKANRADTMVPDDIKDIKHPVIGYIGNICDHKVDIDLVIYIAKTLPEYSFVLVGPIWENNHEISQKIDVARHQNNIFLLGLRTYEVLPNYIKSFDICMIPHKITAYSQSSFPIKIHEFLASGKPIVTTDLPSLIDYADIIYVAADQNEFVTKINAALAESDSQVRERRINISSRNTWESRIKSMEEIIEKI